MESGTVAAKTVMVPLSVPPVNQHGPGPLPTNEPGRTTGPAGTGATFPILMHVTGDEPHPVSGIGADVWTAQYTMAPIGAPTTPLIVIPPASWLRSPVPPSW